MQKRNFRQKTLKYILVSKKWRITTSFLILNPWPAHFDYSGPIKFGNHYYFVHRIWEEQ